MEYSHDHFKDESLSDAAVHGSGRFNADEVRTIMSRTGLRDARQLGMPESTFQKLVEQRAKALGIEPSEGDSLRDRATISAAL